MKTLEGNIVDIVSKKVIKGRLIFGDTIIRIEEDNTVKSTIFILPGSIDAHVHIESTMLTPLEYSKIALKYGVVAAVADPHEIANVCGLNGIKFMQNNARLTPMKLYFGAPSCVPATSFETSGATLSSVDIDQLFLNNECTHLSEMMNFPGVIYKDKGVLEKINIAKKYNKVIDGHAPGLTGYDLRKYVNAGITTDHECTSVYEALEKISLGMKVMLRNGSASKDFSTLISLVKSHPNEVMFCTDDCHPDDLIKGYINKMVEEAIQKEYEIFDVLTAATKTAKMHYNLDVGLLQLNDFADFIVVDNLKDFNVLSTYINGDEVYSSINGLGIKAQNDATVNAYYINKIHMADIQIRKTNDFLNVIQVVPDSLLTKKLTVSLGKETNIIESNVKDDILKIVVLNRYSESSPQVGFINGFGLKSGALASTIAHDSHNIVAVGVNDSDIIKAINILHDSQGGIVAVNNTTSHILPLPIGGLMSDKSCAEVAASYQKITKFSHTLGCKLNAPFMTLAFMSLLVIPEIKIGYKGLFDVNKFNFITLQE